MGYDQWRLSEEQKWSGTVTNCNLTTYWACHMGVEEIQRVRFT